MSTLLALAVLLQPVIVAAQSQSSNPAQPTNPLSGPPAYTPPGPAAAPSPKPEAPLPESPREPSEAMAPQTAPQSAFHEPVGTAAAGWMPASGIAASRPSGAAVAPAKQRRVRSVVIKVGALLGAGAAAGTVYALSKGSPSRPPAQ